MNRLVSTKISSGSQPRLWKKAARVSCPGAVLGNLTGAEVDDALRTEHIRRQNIFNGSLIIQFDQGVHVPSAFLCFSPLYCVPAENTIDNPPGLSEKDVESRKNQHRRSGAG